MSDSDERDNIIKDPLVNDELIDHGYVLVDWFQPDQLDEILQRIVDKLSIRGSELVGNQNEINNVTFHSTFLDSDKGYKKIVWEHLKPLFEGVLKAHFTDHKVIQTNIFNKPPQHGFVTPHQNLTTVDETRFRSISIWAPLQETDEVNGTLYFKPKSHGHFESYRNGTIWWSPLSTSDRIEDYGMQSVNVKKGQALVFDDSIVHASPENRSSSDRLVFHCLAIPAKAKPIFCQRIGDNVQILEVDDEYWQFTRPGDQIPEGERTNTVYSPIKSYSMAQLSKAVDD